MSRCLDISSCYNKPSVETQVNVKIDEKVLKQQPRKHWEVSGHCSTVLFPSEYQEIDFETSGGNYYYLLHTLNTVPDQELVKASRAAYNNVLSKLNSSELQVKNFILPASFMKLKFIDPYSRKKIVEQICEFLGSQTQLRSVVLEQAKVTFANLCRILLAVTRKSLVKELYLWGVLDECNVPFKGPLKSNVVLDDLPRIPFTHNPGGRKYLKQLEGAKGRVKKIDTAESLLVSEFPLVLKTMKSSEAMSLIVYLEKTLEERLTDALNKKSKIDKHSTKSSNTLKLDDFLSSKHGSKVKESGKLTDSYCKPLDLRNHVFTQFDVGVQCNLNKNGQENPVCHIPRFSKQVNDEQSRSCNDYSKAEIECCVEYLKKYEHTEISNSVLRKIYLVALGKLTNVTTLCVNHTLLADGKGEALLSIGSVLRGTLKDLKLLCEQAYIPSDLHCVNDIDALHVIPDIIWCRVKKYCPDLRVHMVCVSMSCYDITKQFLTKSIPLKSIHFDNGVCPTLEKPQLMFFSSLKFLGYYFKNTLENVEITLWHSSGRIDLSLEKLLKEGDSIRCFAYHGPFQYKATITHMCEIALSSSNLVYFKLMVQGDPCFGNLARSLTAELYKKFMPKFHERSIYFMLGTHNS